MTYILLGVLSYFLAFLFDLARSHDSGALKPILWLLAIGTGIVAHIMVATQGSRFEISSAMSMTGWILFIAAAVGTVYSLFIEIPLMKTYVQKSDQNQLITSGTYALVRHPGVLWYMLALIGLILGSRSWLAVIAFPIWVIADILHVWYQDKYLLDGLFSEYEAYRRSTPFLIPNRNSLHEFRRTLGNHKRHVGSFMKESNHDHNG